MFTKNVMVTGGAGFIGSNFIPYFLQKYPNYRVINVDCLTYAACLSNLKEVEENERYVFEKVNICNRAEITRIFKQYNITDVIHFAAESHVDNSIENPSIFLETNVLGTQCLLDVAKEFWHNKDHSIKQEFKDSRFHHVSTDEVYGTLGKEGLFSESTPYAPNSPYSASKASSDMIVRAYHHTYGMNITTSNCSNNYGPKQHKEKLIPVIILNALQGKNIPIYGDGTNIRDWLYVLDHCKGVDLVFHNGESGQTYNIGGRNERNNLYIVNTICTLLDKYAKKADGTSYKDLISFVKDRPGHDKRYAIDASKIEKELNWQAEENFESGIVKTVEYYLKKFN